jgi:bifunctional non-homologous end joining protein LigD
VTDVRVAGHTIELSNTEKVLFPGDGITKGELVDYYRRVARRMVPHLEGYPLALHRFPDGIESGGFFQKEIPDYFPEWIDRVELERERGGTVTHVVCNDAATLVYLADQAVITPHRLLAAAAHPRRPREVIVDLDPPGDDPDLVRHATRLLRELLDRASLPGFVKATGSKGVHVHIPLDGRASFDEVRPFARQLARALAARDPERLTVEHRKASRDGRLFVDWLRNGYGQHAVAPYAVRPLPGAPVAVPLTWDEATVRTFHPQKYTVRNVFRRLDRVADPWAGWRRRARSLVTAARGLEDVAA